MKGGNAEIVTSRPTLVLVNVMECYERGRGGQKYEFLRDIIIECSLLLLKIRTIECK